MFADCFRLAFGHRRKIVAKRWCHTDPQRYLATSLLKVSRRDVRRQGELFCRRTRVSGEGRCLSFQRSLAKRRAVACPLSAAWGSHPRHQSNESAIIPEGNPLRVQLQIQAYWSDSRGASLTETITKDDRL